MDDDASAPGATRFFWGWLTVATSASVAGNVAHAILHAPNGSTALAAAAAVVPPAVLLGSTHSVALLVKACRTGPAYWCALGMTFALAVLAFVLSFDALADLATSLGMPARRAWLWRCAIDVSIAQSTLALLSLTAPASRTSTVLPLAETFENTATAIADIPTGAGPDRATRAASKPIPEPTPLVPAAVDRWRPAAQEFVRSGVTQKDQNVVARILAEHAAGTPPTTIGKKLDVHHETVNRIVARANELAV